MYFDFVHGGRKVIEFTVGVYDGHLIGTFLQSSKGLRPWMSVHENTQLGIATVALVDTVWQVSTRQRLLLRLFTAYKQ
jgi:hypothetical protein